MRFACLNHRVLLTLEDFLGERHHPLLCKQGKPLHGDEPVFLEIRLALQSVGKATGQRPRDEDSEHPCPLECEVVPHSLLSNRRDSAISGVQNRRSFCRMVVSRPT